MKANLGLFTDTYAEMNDFFPNLNSTYIYSSGEEDRSRLPNGWIAKNPAVHFFELIEKSSHFDVVSTASTENVSISLRHLAKLVEFIRSLPGASIYIDITGMGHALWAPILRASLRQTEKTVYCVYSEPRNYTFADVPTEGTIFDLSSKISGIAPLPTFSNFSDPEDPTKVAFIPLLGFEGARLAFIFSKEEPNPPIIPIVGVPGYMLEYPFYTYWGNKNVLTSQQYWKNIRYVPAFCPFSVYYELQELSERYKNYFFRLAPIGTKPHGLGAILFAINHHETTEIVYDNPVRKATRTSGTSRTHVYNISEADLASTDNE